MLYKAIEPPDQSGSPRVSYHVRRWYAHIASAFPLAYHYRAVLAWSSKTDEVAAMFDRLAPLIAAGTISTPVAATYGLGQFREAITKAAQGVGKVLFTPKP
jgi:NADPH:quinone reductase-like Zn-dependent oxidoreductase